MKKTYSPAEEFFQVNKPWGREVRQLRKIVLGSELVEEWKWKTPCYTLKGKNVVLIQRFKNYCAVLFFKGALVKDTDRLLVKPGKHTQAGRLLRFASVEEIKSSQRILAEYIRGAIEVEKVGKKAASSKAKVLLVPEELEQQFKQDPSLQKAFQALTPGRQRAYLIFIEAAKQSSTRLTRIQKCRERIFAGKGLNDCICGLTRKPPYCDGSHRQLKISSIQNN
ncbi:MAG: DUF1801 domain-containing protein [Microcystis sp.]